MAEFAGGALAAENQLSTADDARPDSCFPVFHINHIFGRCCCAHRPLCYGLGASYVFHQGWKAKLLLEDLLKRKVPEELNGG